MDLTFQGRVKVPVIAAPMFLVSCPMLALATCAQGVVGSFPAHSTRTVDVFEEWLVEMEEGIAKLREAGGNPAPFAVNLVVNPTNPRFEGDLELCIKHKVELVLTSKGAPNEVFKHIHRYGGLAFHDVAFKRHAEKALAAGADGIIAVCGGAGGHTGQVNPFALVNEIREITNKPIILAGGLSTGHDVAVAQAMGANMAYMGTRFLAAEEVLAPEAYRDMVVDCEAKDIYYTTALDGFPINIMVPSLEHSTVSFEQLKSMTASEKLDSHQMKDRFKNIWSAGHGVGMVKSKEAAGDICIKLRGEYEQARLSIGQLMTANQ